MTTIEPEARECPVCMEDIKLEEDYCELLCKHVFHPLCIQPWFCTKKTCPKCRMENNTCQHPESSPIHLGLYLFDEIILLKTKIQELERNLIQHQIQEPRQPAFSFRYNTTNLFDEEELDDEEQKENSVHFDSRTERIHLNNDPIDPNVRFLYQQAQRALYQQEYQRLSGERPITLVPPTQLPVISHQQVAPMPFFHHNHHIRQDH
jgi:hypothetical protein